MRRYHYPCPVCCTPMETYFDHLDGQGVLLESGETCPYGCYLHRYAYGYTEVVVDVRGHKVQLGHSYMDSFGDVETHQETLDTLVAAARSTLIEDLRKMAGVDKL